MNVDILCPQCGTLFTVRRELLGKRTKCTRCGTAFVIAEPAATSGIMPKAEPPVAPIAFPDIGAARPSEPAPPPIAAQPAPSAVGGQAASADYRSPECPASVQRFPFLRRVARAYEILAIIAVALAAFQLVMAVVSIIRNPGGALVVILTSGFAMFWTAAAAVTLLFAAQMIRLTLQVEQNTRETADACRHLSEHLGGITHET